MIILFAFATVALYRVYTGDGVEGYSSLPSLDWLNPFDLPFGEAVAPALLTALFLYWGWDSAVAVNEETADPERTPGRSAVISIVLLLVTYLLVSVAAVSFAGVGDTGMGLNNEEDADDIFLSIGAELFGDSLVGTIMMMLVAVSVLTSAAAATQTTIMPTARGALSMAAFKAIPSRFAVMHSKFQTPTWANWGMGIISAAFYLIFTMISPNLLIALVSCLGMLVAVYYGMTGLSAAWFFRKTLTKSVRHFFMRGVIPLSGAIMMAVVFVYGLQQFLLPDWLTDDNGDNVTLFGYGAVGVVGILSLLAGAVLMIIYEFRAPTFFRGKTLEKRVHTAD
jgi:amino acid transporter